MVETLPEEVLRHPAIPCVSALKVEVVVVLGHGVVDGVDGAAGLGVGGDARGAGRPQRDGSRLHRREAIVFVACKQKHYIKHVSDITVWLSFFLN